MSQKLSGFLSDGYTLEHCIEANDFHPEVNIVFRPATVVEKASVVSKITKLGESGKVDEAEKIAAEFMKKKVVSWDLVHGGNELNPVEVPVEITTENMLRLESHLSGSLFNLTLGNIPAVAKELESDEKN